MGRSTAPLAALVSAASVLAHRRRRVPQGCPCSDGKGRASVRLHAGATSVAEKTTEEGSEAADEKVTADEAEENEVLDNELQALFDMASGGSDKLQFEAAIRLPQVDDLLDAEVVTVEELAGFWEGNEEQAIDFDFFKMWYVNVIDFADDVAGGVGASGVDGMLNFADPTADFTDEELIVDAPAMGKEAGEINREIEKERQEQEERMERGFEAGQSPAAVAAAAAAVKPSEPAPAKVRPNSEVTQLFRERCDDDNLLTFKDLSAISEISSLIRDGELTEGELQEIWGTVPKAGAKRSQVDVLAFRDILRKVDDLFEYVVDEEPEEEDDELTLDEAKVELFKNIEDLCEYEKLAFGLDGRDETDESIQKLSERLEELWYTENSPITQIDASVFCGDWELIYSTSKKFRRWQTIMNAGKDVPEPFSSKSFVMNLEIIDEDSFECDCEELLEDEKGEEFGIRSQGVWNLSSQSNVLRGGEDLKLEIRTPDKWEFDSPDGVQFVNEQTMKSQIPRILFNAFVSFVDGDLRIMRSGYLPNNVFIFRKFEDA